MNDNGIRSFDLFEFLIRPLMFSFSSTGKVLLHYIGQMLHWKQRCEAKLATLQRAEATFAETIWDLLWPSDST